MSYRHHHLNENRQASKTDKDIPVYPCPIRLTFQTCILIVLDNDHTNNRIIGTHNDRGFYG